MECSLRSDLMEDFRADFKLFAVFGVLSIINFINRSILMLLNKKIFFGDYKNAR